MRSVDLDVESAVFIRVTGNGSELGDFAAGLDPRGMDGIRSIRREAFLTVFDAGVQFAGDVLIESAAETNVEALTTVANCQDWFSGGEGVLEDCEIGFFPVRVGIVRLCVARSVVERRVHVGRAPGKNEGVQILDFGDKLFRWELQGYGNVRASGFLDGVKIILELARYPIGLFVGGAPGDAHTGAGGGA